MSDFLKNYSYQMRLFADPVVGSRNNTPWVVKRVKTRIFHLRKRKRKKQLSTSKDIFDTDFTFRITYRTRTTVSTDTNLLDNKINLRIICQLADWLIGINTDRVVCVSRIAICRPVFINVPYFVINVHYQRRWRY